MCRPAFEYDPAWLQAGQAFMLDPRLALYGGMQHPAHPASAFGVFMHSSSASYLDLAQFIGDYGAQGHVDTDLKQLFRRVLFNIRIGNHDDHLRNHGFIRTTTGWRLAPTYDINPNPHKDEHGVTLDGQTREPDIHAALACADL